MEDPPQVIQLILLGGLVCLSAFFSGSEAAFFSLSDLHLRRMQEDGRSLAQALRNLLARPRRILITILSGNEISNVSISAIAGGIGISLGLPWWLIVLVTTTVLLTVCEILPKLIARKWPEGFSHLAYRPLTVFMVLLTPLRIVLQVFVKWLDTGESQNGNGNERHIGEDEFLMLVGLGLQEGEIKGREGKLIEAVFEMGDTQTSQIMTPRTEVFALPVGATLAEAMEQNKDKRHSRIPVYGEDLDDIRGILYANDMIRFLANGDKDARVETLCHAPEFSPEQKKVSDLFRSMRRRKTHLSVVVDEYGGVSGIVTMDDILIELFGWLVKGETEPAFGEAKRVAEGVYQVPGRMEVETFNEWADAPVEPRGNETLGGAVFTRLGYLPKVGEIINVDGHSFKVLEMEGRRITRLRVTLKKMEAD